MVKIRVFVPLTIVATFYNNPMFCSFSMYLQRKFSIDMQFFYLKILFGFNKFCKPSRRMKVFCNIVLLLISGRYCLGCPRLDNGQSLVPEPPERITGTIFISALSEPRTISVNKRFNDFVYFWILV